MVFVSDLCIRKRKPLTIIALLLITFFLNLIANKFYLYTNDRVLHFTSLY